MLRSSLSVVIGRRRSSVSELWPVPKSSKATPTPASRSRASWGSTRSIWVMAAVSVISTSISAGSSPWSLSTASSQSAKPASSNCSGDTLTATGSTARPSARQRRNCWAAWRSSSAPRATIWPVRSAAGMNSTGLTRPKPGRCQRTRASKPLSSRLRATNLGWYSSTNSHCSMAAPSACSISSSVPDRLAMPGSKSTTVAPA
mmetsp:Transcript_21607/g.51304  ORF Transcript_21607/g.51304 Transcript_21607/m.51304 type:complete len:202 (+) Transcript_21607:628-1233(+)